MAIEIEIPKEMKTQNTNQVNTKKPINGMKFVIVVLVLLFILISGGIAWFIVKGRFDQRAIEKAQVNKLTAA